MICVLLASDSLDRGFDNLFLSQTKDYKKNDICFFCTDHAALSIKNKDW